MSKPPKVPLDPRIRRWRTALFLLFLLPGIALASWVTRTPAIRDAVGASTAGMGLIIFGLSVGSMAGVLVSGAFVARKGGRFTAMLGASSLLIGLSVLSAGAGTGTGWLVFAGLAFFGAGTGMQEIAVNIEGAAVEAVLGRPVLPALHGCFSAGTCVGAGAGIALTALDMPVAGHLLAVTVLLAAGVVWALRNMPDGTGLEPRGAGGRALADRLEVWRDRRVLMLGLIVLGVALAEGSANDWLPLIMVDGYRLDSVAGSVAYTLFAASMAVGRFTGGQAVSRLGRVLVMRGSACLAAIGVLGVILAPGPLTAGLATVLWGLGAALGFPVALSAAGDGPDGGAARVGAVATTGYLAFLVGPPALGLLGEAVGLRHALFAVLAVVVLAGTMAPALRAASPRPREGGGNGRAEAATEEDARR
ncbi:MFS transporter [Streptomyces tsukubensis]|uniref:MFS transporter n=1 Tax=Streptomyces tsukubensis TaxID=83656 RepID=A0A1V4AEK9_9ACTN|nr:MFS transporter [Streptomyces tsukubensis]OON82546.1 hypothetical protein B1H18_00180 [Streptomyces tsukubensis]QFR92291.1 MFS transporter [Streptomyces tsukubensis]